ncbi:hypothetical protein DFH06DRAFT_1172611 [Mycena polygramma]|nr:hypothetical protein DFH06DRAFT_1172611 [Mycena polygramma]
MSTRRWADQYPNQGPPPLDTLVQHWGVRGPDRDLNRSRAFALEHQHDPNPDARFDEFVGGLQDAHIDSRSRPIMGGQAYDAKTYHTTYGVSAPFVAREPRNRKPNGKPEPLTQEEKRDVRARKEVINGRLGNVNPHHLYTSIPRADGKGNTIGACCEFLTLQPYFLATQGTLRKVHAHAREISSGRDRVFCDICKKFATKATNEFLGLRIIDTVTGTIYESKQTATAFATYEAQQAFKQQEAAKQQQAIHAAHLAQQMSQLTVAPQTTSTTVQYYQQNQFPTMPIVGPSTHTSASGSSKKSSRSHKTTLRY